MSARSTTSASAPCHMPDKGFADGWGLGRHVLGSNYFHYVRDPVGQLHRIFLPTSTTCRSTRTGRTAIIRRGFLLRVGSEPAGGLRAQLRECSKMRLLAGAGYVLLRLDAGVLDDLARTVRFRRRKISQCRRGSSRRPRATGSRNRSPDRPVEDFELAVAIDPLSRRAAGVSGGATRANQVIQRKPGRPASENGRKFRQRAGARSGSATAEDFQLAAAIAAAPRSASVSKNMSMWPAMTSLSAGCAPR